MMHFFPLVFISDIREIARLQTQRRGDFLLDKQVTHWEPITRCIQEKRRLRRPSQHHHSLKYKIETEFAAKREHDCLW